MKLLIYFAILCNEQFIGVGFLQNEVLILALPRTPKILIIFSNS